MPRIWRQEEAGQALSLPGLNNKEKVWPRQFSHAWPPGEQIHLVTLWQLSLHYHLTDGVPSCRLLWWDHQDGFGVLPGPTPRVSGLPGLGLRCGFLSFFLAVWIRCTLYQDYWGSPSARQRSYPSLPDGLSCSFIWDRLPWACLYPEEAPAFLATACFSLPFWPCCQRPLVPGWLLRRAWASESHLGPWVSLGNFWACLWGKQRGEGALLESAACSLMLRAFPLLSSAAPLVAQWLYPV